VANQAATLCAAWSDRISRWMRDLLTSLGRLSTLGDRLKEALAAIKALLGRLKNQPAAVALERLKGRGAGNPQFFRLESVRAIAHKYGIDISGLAITLGSTKIRGVCGNTFPDGHIVLYSPGFQSEELLARTLVHEKLHHDELAAGAPFPYAEDEREEWEDRAYAYEDEWWDRQPIRPEPRTK
jgi:hypothetical protein